MQTPDLTYAIGLQPRDAVAYLAGLGVVPTRNWYDIWQESRAKALTIAGMTRLDMLQDVHTALIDAVRTGKTEAQFVRETVPLLRTKGWTGKRQVINKKTGEVTEKGRDLPARMELVFRQNTQTAYIAASYHERLANAAEQPWWMYVATRDERSRPHHAALHGKVFRFDHLFWKTHHPPNGFGCRCDVLALSDKDLQRDGLTPETGGQMVSRDIILNPHAPEGLQVRREVWGWQSEPGAPIHWTDPGFSYNCGEVWAEDLVSTLPEPWQGGGATTWDTLGLPPLRTVPAEARLPAPDLLPAAETRLAAEEQLAHTLGFAAGQAFILTETPLGERVIRRDLLPHMVGKERDARERFAGYILPTLQDPYEIWLKEHADGKLRENYIGLFKDAKYALLVVVRVNRDGSLFWNFMHREDKKMDKLREGLLVHQRKRDSKS